MRDWHSKETGKIDETSEDTVDRLSGGWPGGLP